MTSFEKFGEAFQIKLLYHLIADAKFALRVLEILKPNFFSNDNYAEIAEQVIQWNEKYDSLPTFDNLKTIFKTKIEDTVQSEYMVDIVDAISGCKDMSDKQFIIDETVQFCKQQAWRNHIIGSIDFLKEERYDEIMKSAQKAMTAGESKEVGHMFVDHVMSRTAAKRIPIPTGWDLIDERIAGGLSAGELGLILGGTGAGKSFLLANLAYNCFIRGGTPVIYTFELYEIPCALRLDSKITGIPLTKLLLDTEGLYRERVAAKIKKIQSQFEHKPEIIIKEYPTKGASVTTMKNHLLQLKAQNIHPSMILVDYADLVMPTSKYIERRHELESIVEELRGWAKNEELPLWSASQANRDGMDTSIVHLKNIAESIAKSQVADLVISIGRTDRLVEMLMACYYIAKSRLGPDKLAFTGRFDTSIMDFTVDKLGYNEEDFAKDRQHAMSKAASNVLNNLEIKSKNTNNLDSILKLLDED